MPFSSVTKIRFGDVDYAQIVYYPRFFYLFHMAIEDFFDDYLGIPYVQVLRDERLGLPAVHAEADYHHPLHFGDVVRVGLCIERIGGSSVDFGYWIRREEDDVLCARGRVTIVTVDMETGKSIRIPRKYRELFEAYMAECRAAGEI